MKYSQVLKRRLAGILEEHAAIERGEDPQAFIPVGLREFDKRAGHRRKIMHLYGAATGEGKSLFKLHLMREAAKRGYKVFVLDFEDPEETTADRDFASATGINSAKIGAGSLTDKEISQIRIALKGMAWADNITIVCGVKTGAEALELLNEQEADLVIVDYLSALPHGKAGREQAVSDFCWGLTKYAQDFNAAVVAFSQLKAEVTARGQRMYEMDKRNRQYKNDDGTQLPNIEGFRGFDNTDLAWCTDAGKTAKSLGFMFRPGRHYMRLDKKCKVADDRMEFNWPKKNFGAEGMITVGLDLASARLYDLPEKTK